jgi:ATP-dependent Clp protease protease subunit
MIFSVKQNTITAYGIIWNGNGMEFVSLFTQLEGQYSQITVKLHTYGGSVFDGNLIYNTLRNSKADIEIHIVGIAASMGAVISLSRNSKVYMVENGYMMIHAPSGETYGTAIDHENNAKLLKSIESNFLKKLVEKTGKAENYVKKWLTGDNWFDATEALKEGLITGIIDSEIQTDIIAPEQLGITETYNRFSALLLPENVKQKLDQDMKKPIIEALSLQGVTAESSDTAVIDAVRNHYEGKIKKAEGDLQIANDKAIVAEAKLKEQGKAAITAEIEAAKKAGKITQEQMATYEGIAEASGIDALKTVLGAIPARQSITGQMQGNGGKNTAPVGRENWDFDKWQKEDPKGFEALAKDEPETFQDLLNAKYKK